MDRFIAGFAAVEDRDLMLCAPQGVAYQRDMAQRVAVPYFDIYRTYTSDEQRDIAAKINSGRVSLVNKHVGKDVGVLDIGVGCGEFIQARPNTFGFDVEPKAAAWLKEIKRWSDSFAAFEAFTFWDVIEHLEEPELYFRRMHGGSYLFTCLPVFGDLNRIRESRHYRPGEHLYYWTVRGFVGWMGLHSFDLIERQDFETTAGRDNIVSFAFQKRH